MKVPLSWLREFVNAPEENSAALIEFADLLTMAGLEVEEIHTTPNGEPVLDTKVTPNRGDWTSVYGTAREAAAGDPSRTLQPLTTPPVSPLNDDTLQITIEDTENCPRYVGILIRGVKIGATPEKFRQRLSAALGDKYKPVNAVVDITNYVMLETGQPLHAFDFDTIPQGHIVVRPARAGEQITTLDNAQRDLPENTLCICDVTRPIAIAGVMGGADTEISARTVNILLESAHFHPVSIRRTAKRLNLPTEASYRFERFVDPEMAPVAAARAAWQIVENCGGEIVGVVDALPEPLPRRRVIARMERIRSLLGVDVERDAAIDALERLGVSVERSSGALDCLIPSWRPDLTIEEDIAEEVGRISVGFGNLPETLPPVTSGRGRDSARGLFVERVQDILVQAGLQEIVGHSLSASEAAASQSDAQVLIKNPMAIPYSALRTSLLPNLFSVVERAHAAGLRDAAIFEVGAVYECRETCYAEPLRIAGVVCGSALSQIWAVRPETLPADFFFAKGIVERLLSDLGVQGAAFAASEQHPLGHPYRTATITVGGELLGTVAEAAPAFLQQHDLPRRLCFFELDGDALQRIAHDAMVRYTPLPRFPSVVRDLAPVLDSAIEYEKVATAVRESAGLLLADLRLTDVYVGQSLPDGKRSLTLRLTFRSAERTLTDTEVEAVLEVVRETLTAQFGADLRGG